jgi:hypothetical protein
VLGLISLACGDSDTDNYDDINSNTNRSSNRSSSSRHSRKDNNSNGFGDNVGMKILTTLNGKSV